MGAPEQRRSATIISSKPHLSLSWHKIPSRDRLPLHNNLHVTERIYYECSKDHAMS